MTRHRVIEVDSRSLKSIQTTLDEASVDGWELVAATNHERTFQINLFFKRES